MTTPLTVLMSLFLVFGFGGSGNAAKIGHVQLIEPQKPALEVSVAVPEENGQRIVRLSTADPHLDVVIRNVSDKPLAFYAEDCSEGYNTLHLELLAVDGKTLPEAIIVERNVSAWLSNAIRTVTLEPGAVMVREVHFTADHSVMGFPYHNFPEMKAGDVHKISMRAVFAYGQDSGFTVRFHRKGAAAVLPIAALSNAALSSDGKTSPAKWTGKITSDTNEYRVEQYSP